MPPAAPCGPLLRPMPKFPRKSAAQTAKEDALLAGIVYPSSAIATRGQAERASTFHCARRDRCRRETTGSAAVHAR